MRILQATIETQGAEGDDFFWATVGEIVQFPMFVCHAYPSSCGCDRAWAGIESSRATTTAIVAETDLTETEVATRVHESLLRSGWARAIEDPAEIDELAAELTSEILTTAQMYEVGTVLGVHSLGTDNDEHEGGVPRQLIVRGSGYQQPIVG